MSWLENPSNILCPFSHASTTFFGYRFFSIDDVGNIRATGELSRAFYYLVGVARDGGGAVAQVPVRISLICGAPVQCSTGGLAFDVDENAPPGSQVGTVKAAGSGVTYQFMTTGASAVFSINAETYVARNCLFDVLLIIGIFSCSTDSKETMFYICTTEKWSAIILQAFLIHTGA